MSLMLADTNECIQPDPAYRVGASENHFSRTELLQRACERYFLQTPHPSQRAMLSTAHFLDPFQFITPSPTCIILPATHSLVVSGGKFIG